MVPPLVQHTFANQLEPRRELQRLVFEHGSEILLGNKPRVANFVGIDVKVDVGLDEQDIINCIDVSMVLQMSLLLRGGVSLLSCSPHLPSLGDL